MLGNSLIEGGLMNHVVKDHTFKNEKLFYRFSVHEKDHGHPPEVLLNSFRAPHGKRHWQARKRSSSPRKN